MSCQRTLHTDPDNTGTSQTYSIWQPHFTLKPGNKRFYSINTSKIPGELSRVNMISLHVKITCYFQKWKDHHCYGYIIPFKVLWCVPVWWKRHQFFLENLRLSSEVFGNFRKHFSDLRRIWICWLVIVVLKYQFLFVYKVAPISVCETSSRFSELRHFGLNNSLCQRIKQI